ncbi:MAG TPA: hypothetical protein PK771_08625, partial [Spirochaetota bacterium]|nr:hypothetical protein [Spirochaetota bacterium]
GEVDKENLEYLELYHKGLSEFEEWKWEESLKTFENLKSIKESDATVDIYIDRIKKFLVSPPPSNWDGVYTLSEK